MWLNSSLCQPRLLQGLFILPFYKPQKARTVVALNENEGCIEESGCKRGYEEHGKRAEGDGKQQRREA